VVGDADLGAGKLLLPDELVAAGERRVSELEWRLGLAQRGTEVPLAQQVLHPGQRRFGAGVLRHHLQQRRIGVGERRLFGERQAPAVEDGGQYRLGFVALLGSFGLGH
jgi:hypothetical protein